MPPRKAGFFAYIFSLKRSVKQEKNAALCISSNLKATSKNSGTFENTKKVNFPLSIVFDQALQLFSSDQPIPCITPQHTRHNVTKKEIVRNELLFHVQVCTSQFNVIVYIYTVLSGENVLNIPVM